MSKARMVIEAVGEWQLLDFNSPKKKILDNDEVALYKLDGYARNVDPGNSIYGYDDIYFLVNKKLDKSDPQHRLMILRGRDNFSVDQRGVGKQHHLPKEVKAIINKHE